MRTRLVNCSDYGSLSDESSACSVFLSNRHGEIEYSETTLRIQRAAANLKETLPIFLTLMILGMVQGVDLTLLGACWLGLRVAFFILYSLGIEKSQIRCLDTGVDSASGYGKYLIIGSVSVQMQRF